VLLQLMTLRLNTSTAQHQLFHLSLAPASSVLLLPSSSLFPASSRHQLFLLLPGSSFKRAASEWLQLVPASDRLHEQLFLLLPGSNLVPASSRFQLFLLLPGSSFKQVSAVPALAWFQLQAGFSCSCSCLVPASSRF
jgi:hypothetical protein